MRGWFPSVSVAVSTTLERFPFLGMENPAWKLGNVRQNPVSTARFHGFHAWKHFAAWKPKVSISFQGGFHPEGTR